MALKHLAISLVGTAVALTSLIAVSAQSAPGHLSLRVASGGGGVVTAGNYRLVSAIGQHDAGVKQTGGYLLAGGVLAASGGGLQPTATPTSAPATPTPPPTAGDGSTSWLPMVNR